MTTVGPPGGPSGAADPASDRVRGEAAPRGQRADRRRRQDRHVVDHHRAPARSTRPRSPSSAPRRPRCAPTGTGSCSSPRAPSRPACPALGLRGRRPAPRRRHAAGGLRGRPDPPDARLRGARWPPTTWSSGQVLLAPLDFTIRQQYLHARATLGRLLDLGVVPVVNENDAIADDEIRFGDNDRLAALVAHLRRRPTCSCCSPTRPGCSRPTPASTPSASLIEEIVEVDHSLESLAGGTGIGAGQRRHGLEAGRGQDRRLVRGEGRHRRRPRGTASSQAVVAGEPGRRHRRAPEDAAAAGPQALDRVRRRLERHDRRRRRRPPGPARARRVAAAGRRGRR